MIDGGDDLRAVGSVGAGGGQRKHTGTETLDLKQSLYC